MGWKGTTRSVFATMRAIERENERARKVQAKEEALDKAQAAVSQYEYLIKSITSLHKECLSEYNWHEINQEPEPAEPKKVTFRQDKAKNKIDSYSPNVITKKLKLDRVAITLMDKSLSNSKEKDTKDYLEKLSKYQFDKNQWDINQKISKKLLSKKMSFYEEFFKESHPFDDIDFLGQNVGFSSLGNNTLDVEVELNKFEDVIPDEEYFLRQSGTLSTKKMSKAKGFDFYQDYVCSALMRVAREMFGLLPVDLLRVNGLVDALNTSTGHIEKEVMLSLYIPRESLEKINWEHIDPSDALCNFVHNMQFMKTSGFKPVKKVELPKS